MDHNKNLINVADDDTSQEIDATVPKLASMNTKLYVALLLAIIAIIFQSFYINAANKRAEMNTELMYVKMYPNGTWDVEYRASGTEADFFPLTIDKLIQDYVEARYSVRPGQMRREFGFAAIFMSPQLRGWFTGTGERQFNAKVQAEKLNAASLSEDIEVRFVDHFDYSTGVFKRGNSDLYRTNVFIQRTVMDQLGNPQGDAVNEVVTLHWRIKSTNELKGLSRDDLRANPIGLEIMKDKKVLDVSSTK